MAYTLKIWTFNEADGWLSEYVPLPETLEDARSLANWWVLHRPEHQMEVLILRGGEIVDRIVKGRLAFAERISERRDT